MQCLHYVRCLFGVEDLYHLQDAVRMIMINTDINGYLMGPLRTKMHSLTLAKLQFLAYDLYVCNVTKIW